MKKKIISKDDKAISTKSVLDMLSAIPIFDSFSFDDLSTILKYMRYVHLNSEQYVFKEGEKGEYMFFVVDGKLDVLKKSASENNYARITILTKGASLGEMSIIDNYPRSAAVKARTESILITLSQDGFDFILEKYPRLGIMILKAISRMLSLRLRRTSSRLADYMLSED
ncbi:Cyclic nucleotide-binding domain-containing protein [Candidatus Magnetomoraceae bacterium gMMP-15]